MYGLEHHIVEINGDVTDAGRTNERRRRTREDRATQPMDAGWLSFAKSIHQTSSDRAMKLSSQFWCLHQGVILVNLIHLLDLRILATLAVLMTGDYLCILISIDEFSVVPDLKGLLDLKPTICFLMVENKSFQLITYIDILPTMTLPMLKANIYIFHIAINLGVERRSVG